MSEPPPEEPELSAEDRAILEAFDTMEGWDTVPSEPSLSSPRQNTDGDEILKDILLVFFSEVEEDIMAMRQALSRLEQGDSIDPAPLAFIRRVAHKIRGTAGTMSYHTLAAIAASIERIVGAITSGKIAALLGVNALVQAVFALETTLHDIMRTGRESETPRRELEAHLQKLALEQQEPFVRVHAGHLEQLRQHTEQLTALHVPLLQAQLQMETALQELYAAQLQQQRIERQLIALSPVANPPQPRYDVHPISSWIARLLSEAAQKNELFHPRKFRPRTRLTRPGAGAQEEKPVTERDRLLRSLSEANANLAPAFAHVRAAFAQLQAVLDKYIAHADTVRNDTLGLQTAPTNP
jgi:chemosensory pili system protein ChpA (sensor histidine kinase/response regulator)